MKIGPDDQMDEAISALIDGELDGESDRELRQQLIERICTEQPLKERWTHYHLISDSLSNNLPSELYRDLSERVQSLLENEPCHSLSDNGADKADGKFSKVIDASQRFSRSASLTTPELSRKQLMMKRVAGFAIAASVATVALVSYQIGLQQHLDENLLAQQKASPVPAQQQELASMNPTQMATVNGVTVLASPVSNPQYHLRPANTAPGVYSPPGVSNNSSNSRMTIDYNILDLHKNAVRNLQNSNLAQLPGRVEVDNAHQLSESESVLLHQYLMDHNQRFSSSRVQGVLPLARIMAVPTQMSPQ